MKRKILLSGFSLITLLSAGCARLGLDSGSSSGSQKMCSIDKTQSFAEEEIQSEQTINVGEDYDNYIVKFSDDTITQEEFDENEGLQPSGNTVREYKVSGMSLQSVRGSTYSLTLKGSYEEKMAALEKLAGQRQVEYVEPDYPVYEVEQDIAGTSDPYFANQWAHKAVQSEKAWALTQGSKEIVVAVVDSGIDYNHPDLKNNMWKNPQETVNGKDDDGNGYVDDIYGWNFDLNNNSPTTVNGSSHGTHVAGIIGATANNGIGVAGIAPKVKLMALRFISKSGSGSTSGAIRAINYAVDKKAFVINNSWGSSGKSQALQTAIKRAEDAGILFTAAAGNGHNSKGYDIDDEGYYPAGYSYSNIITVAATSESDSLTKFSNWGLTRVDVAAPGYSILSTVTNGKYTKMSGTSMATPLVSGLAVLIKAANPSLDYLSVKKIMQLSSDPVASLKNKVASGGRVNAYKAVMMAIGSSGGNPESPILEVPCN